jgi:hypothetical protein
MARVLVVKSWDRYQHYKDRDPPWVKLYRDTLTTEAWVLGTDLSRLLQLASTMLAARYSNKIPLTFPLLRKVMSLDCTEPDFASAIAHLVEYDFLEIQEVADVPKPDASSVLAACTSETEQRQSRGRGREDRSAGKPPTDEAPSWAEDFKAAFPRRAGDPNWRGAWRAAGARIAEGHTVAEFLAGAGRYAEFCRVTGKLNSEFVQQASRFLGPGKQFLEPWTPPPTKAQTAQDANLDASQQWLRQGT